MSFEPTKVIEMKDGKQVGQTMTQHAENIPYGNTTVGAELTKINTDLPELFQWHKLTEFTPNGALDITLPDANEYCFANAVGTITVPADVLKEVTMVTGGYAQTFNNSAGGSLTINRTYTDGILKLIYSNSFQNGSMVSHKVVVYYR